MNLLCFDIAVRALGPCRSHFVDDAALFNEKQQLFFTLPVLPDTHYLPAGALALGLDSPLPDGRRFKSPNSQLAMSPRPLGNQLLTCTSVWAPRFIATHALGARPSNAHWSLPVPAGDGLHFHCVTAHLLAKALESTCPSLL